MPPAARTGDPTSHGGAIGTAPPFAAAAVTTVLIAGRPAAVVGSVHLCVVPAHVPLGPGNVIIPNPAAAASGLVLIGGTPAARVGDRTTCGANVVLGAFTVMIGGPG